MNHPHTSPPPSFSKLSHGLLVLLATALTGPACDAVMGTAVDNVHDSFEEEEHIDIPEFLADAGNLLPTDTPHLPGYHRAQIMVTVDAADTTTNVDEKALFTVSGVFDAGNNPPQIDAFVWNDQKVKERLELGSTAIPGLDVQLDKALEQDEGEMCPPEPTNGLIECLVGDAEQVFSVVDNYVFLAPHGGKIELHTDDQAEAAQAHSFPHQNANYNMADHSLAWSLKGFHPDSGRAYKHFHITSKDIGRSSFPWLDLIGPKIENIFGGFPYAVAFHGMQDKAEKYTIYVGGASSDCVRDQVIASLTAVLAQEPPETVSVVNSPDPDLAGKNELNLVNWLTLGGEGGIQLEQTMSVREDYGTEVAHAMAELLPTLDTLCPPQP